VCSDVLTVNSQENSLKSQTKPIKSQNYLYLYVILLVFFVNLLLKQQSTQLPAMKAVISHENFVCPMKLATERDNSSCSA
jgi:hypothetical protein